jgi:hypothetical protein
MNMNMNMNMIMNMNIYVQQRLTFTQGPNQSVFSYIKTNETKRFLFDIENYETKHNIYSCILR